MHDYVRAFSVLVQDSQHAKIFTANFILPWKSDNQLDGTA